MVKVQVVLLGGLVSLVLLQYLFILLRGGRLLGRYRRLQKSFIISPKSSRPLLSSKVNAITSRSISPTRSLSPLPICSRQEPYDLSLCLTTSEERSGERRCRPEHEIFHSHGYRCITYDMLQWMPDRVLAKARRPRIYSIYPQDIPLPSILEAVRKSRPIPMVPINNPKLVLIRTSQSVCPLNETQPRERYNLIIIVKSSPANDARRGRLRRLISKQTHKLNTTVSLLFSLGVPAANGNQSELLATIRDEAVHFDDILLTDFTDTYYNLTLKTLLNLRFAHVACGGASPLFAFMDDDHGLNLAALLDYFHKFEGEYRGQLRHSIFGFVYQHPKVIRKPGHKWTLTRSEMPFYMYAAYAAGPCYFIGAEAVAALSKAAAFTKPFAMEDAYVGLIAAKLGIKMHSLPDVHLHGSRLNKQLKWVPLIASLEYVEKYIA